MADAERLTLGSFSPHVGDTFQCQLESGEALSFELIEAEGRGGDEAGQPERFSLVFLDPAASSESYLPQAIYALRHEKMGSVQIFIVPIGPDPQRYGMRYEAVFA
jgi:hypothetical protein